MKTHTQTRLSRVFKALLATLIAASTMALFSPAAYAGTFTDVPPGAFYENDVETLVSRGITQGTTATTYSPNQNITRGQMVVFLFRYSGSPSGTPNTQIFDDVPAGTLFTVPTNWAYFSGITQGVDARNFAPNATVTRGQMVTFLWRCAGKPNTATPANFPDVSPGAFYAKAVDWARKTGVTLGTQNGTFDPDAAVTRGAMASFIVRMGKELTWDACDKDFNSTAGDQPDKITGQPGAPSAIAGRAVIRLINAADRSIKFTLGASVDKTVAKCVGECPAYATSVTVPDSACRNSSSPARTVGTTTVDIGPGSHDVVITAADTSPFAQQWTNLQGGEVYEFCVVRRFQG